MAFWNSLLFVNFLEIVSAVSLPVLAVVSPVVIRYTLCLLGSFPSGVTPALPRTYLPHRPFVWTTVARDNKLVSVRKTEESVRDSENPTYRDSST